ncbi:MAG TPA: hypothetical protein VF733_05755 [Candidatus Saccharimonadales bacterium]
MISRSHQHTHFLRSIRAEIEDYRQSEKTRAFASRLNVTAVVGPIAMGKTTLIKESGLHKVNTATSRLPRSTDTHYRYYDFSNNRDRSKVTQDIREGNFVQIASHPANHEVYGTLPSDFDSAQVNLLDVTAVEYYNLLKKNTFGSFSGVYVVTPTYEQWQSQWYSRDANEQGTLDQDTLKSRTHEAYLSLSACMNDPDMRFLVNDTPEISGARLRELAEGAAITCAEQSRGIMAAKHILAGIGSSGVLGDFERPIQ